MLDRKQHADSAPAPTRRLFFQGGMTLLALFLPVAADAGPFDTLELDRRARIIKQGPIMIPPPGSKAPTGLAGADIVAPQRGFIGIDWALSEKREITLMLLTAQQKAQLARGAQPRGDPLMRFDIVGPETAGQNAQVERGSYYIAFLNHAATPIQLLYRASFLPF